MSIRDVIKDGVLAGFAGNTQWNFSEMIMVFCISCIVSVYIFYIYKCVCKSIFYSKDINVTMAGIVVLVAAVMMAMQSSLIVSLGMVGALSIVRFRNAVKNPMDLMFLFWSVSAGIICGVGLYLLVIVLCIVMTFMIIVLNKIPQSKPNGLLVLCDSKGDVNWSVVKECAKKHCKYVKEKSRNIVGKETELILELKTSDEEMLLEEMRKKFDLEQIKYITYDGEYRS